MPDSERIEFDEELGSRLPILLAQLYSDAVYAKSTLERHQSAFYLWEATIKLMGGAAVVSWAARNERDDQIAETLKSLTRPALGHWWSYCKTLVPRLAESDPGFSLQRQMLFGKSRDDLPRLAGLDSLLREVAGQPAGSRAMVSLQSLFDRIVSYRNREIGHGVAGRRPREFYDRVSRALLAGGAELLRHLDPLAGRTLVFVGEIQKTDDGGWNASCLTLKGESPRRGAPLRITETDKARDLQPNRLYLQPAAAEPPEWTSLYPLAVFNADSHDLLLLNGRPKDHETEYLSYRFATHEQHPDAACVQELLGRLLKMEVPAAQVQLWADAVSTDESTTDSQSAGTGRCIGDFELLTRLGEGAMGVVYRARQAILGRQVALKCQRRVGNAVTDQRFQREIRALGRVNHPNLVRVFASGNDGDQWYYAMELVEGATLATFCTQLEERLHDPDKVTSNSWRETLSIACDQTRKEEQPLVAGRETPPAVETAVEPAPVVEVVDRDYISQVVDLVQQAAEAAHALHLANVVHRDIKPGNIMVSADGRRCYLMDLGLAHVVDEGKGNLTRTRQFIGSLPYASPEQVAATGSIDRRTDIYSLGATLWELLTLRRLFDATEETSPPELMRRIQFDVPQSPRRIHPHVSRDLEAVILHCLEKNPAHRYATARELADDLSRILRGESIELPTGLFRSFWQEAKRVGRSVKPAFPYAAAMVVVAYSLWMAWTVTPTKTQQLSSVSVGPTALKPPDAPDKPATPPDAKTKTGRAQVPPELAEQPVAIPTSRLVAMAQPNSYAVLVGVRQSADNAGPLNAFADNDVELTAASLLAAGFNEARVIVLSGQRAQGHADRMPTRSNVLRELQTAAEKVGTNGLLVFAYSGNGVIAGGEQRLIASDSIMTDFKTLIELDACQRVLSGSPARFQASFVDACRTDLGAAHRGLEDKEPRARILFSTKPGALAYEDKPLGASIFYHFLNRGLRGEADLNQDRRLTVKELETFVRRKVRDYAKSHLKLDQFPEAADAEESDEVLVQWTPPKAYALLVGTSQVDLGVGRVIRLKGPPNDVRLTRDVLERSYGFRPDDIVVLSQEAGDDRPVRAAIEREFRSLARKAHGGDEVVILFSGSGCETATGQLFLTADSREIKSGDSLEYTNAISSNDVRNWAAALSATGAHVSFVVDMCRAGGMLQGSPDGVVAIYGSESDEFAAERRFPPDNVVYGVLTNTLCRLLDKAGRHGTGLTYRELGLRLQSEYSAMNRTQLPYVEGSQTDLDREVLASSAHESRSRITLSPMPGTGEWSVNVGLAFGVRKGCVLAVYPPADDEKPDTLAGYVVVDSENYFDSTVKPVEYAGLPATTKLPRDGRCALVRLEFGDLRLPIAVDIHDADKLAKGAPPSVQDKLLHDVKKSLQQAELRSDSVFRVVDRLADANWIVQFRKDRLALLPTSRADSSSAQFAQSGNIDLPIRPGVEATEIMSHLRFIARAQNLINAAALESSAASQFAYLGYTPPTVQRAGQGPPQIRLELVKCKDPSDGIGQVAVEADRTLHPGDYVAFRVSNVGRIPVAVALLFVDSNFEVQLIFPKEEQKLRLGAAGQSDSRVFQTSAFRVNDTTVGTEHVLAVAVPAGTESHLVDFGFLQSEKRTSSAPPPPVANPLSGLLEKAVLGKGSSTGLTSDDLSKIDVKLVSWNVTKG